jgi:hypothetical protein
VSLAWLLLPACLAAWVLTPIHLLFQFLLSRQFSDPGAPNAPLVSVMCGGYFVGVV